jgi:hypothetical protein
MRPPSGPPNGDFVMTRYLDRDDLPLLKRLERLRVGVDRLVHPTDASAIVGG